MENKGKLMENKGKLMENKGKLILPSLLCEKVQNPTNQRIDSSGFEPGPAVWGSSLAKLI